MRFAVTVILMLALGLVGCVPTIEQPAEGETQTAIMTRIVCVGPPEGIQAEIELPGGEHWGSPYPSYAGASEMKVGDTIEFDDQEVDVVFEQGKWIVLGPSD